jgi:LmbE family N-acetylglucosaminyl deacetylase
VKNHAAAYLDFVQSGVELIRKGHKLPLGGADTVRSNGKGAKVLILSPHPDDECVMAALPLRLQEEIGCEIVNYAVTLGSNAARKDGRLAELRDACAILGFRNEVPNQGRGFDKVNPKSRLADPADWQKKVEETAAFLLAERPALVTFPHDDDFNSTHIGVHHLGMDALKLASQRDPSFKTSILETEFWHAMNGPNLLIGVSAEQEALTIAALAAHTGEVERNPYHLLHPGRMMDNVMRGSEVVGGQGGAAVSFDFAMIYRLSRWSAGAQQAPWPNGRTFAPGQSLKEILG